MADREVIIINPEQQAREQMNADMKRLKANPLDEAKVAGGVFKNAEDDGFHNGAGQAVDKDGNVLDVEEAETEATPKAAAKKAARSR